MAIAFLALAASIPIKASLYSTMARPLCAEDRLGQSEQPSSRIVGRATSSAAERTYGHTERLRHLLWNGYHEEACEALGRIASGAEDAARLNGAAVEAKARRLVARCTELRAYIENNDGSGKNLGR